MGNDERGELALPEHPPDRPRVVDEAHEVLTAYGWQLTGTGAFAVLVWAAATWLHQPAPLPLRTQPKILVRHQLVYREAVVQLDHVQILRPDPGPFVCQLSRPGRGRLMGFVWIRKLP